MSRAVMQRALDALVDVARDLASSQCEDLYAALGHRSPRLHDAAKRELEQIDGAIESLSAALVQQDEPVAWIEHHKGGDNLCWEDPGGTKTPLYAAPLAAPAPTYDAVAEVIGCFDAAFAEGLHDAIANTADLTLKDLVERRLMHALYAAQGVAATQPAPVAQPLTADQIQVGALGAGIDRAQAVFKLKAGGASSVNPVSEAAIYAALVEVLGQPIDRSEVLLSCIAIAIKKHSEDK